MLHCIVYQLKCKQRCDTDSRKDYVSFQYSYISSCRALSLFACEPMNMYTDVGLETRHKMGYPLLKDIFVQTGMHSFPSKPRRLDGAPEHSVKRPLHSSFYARDMRRLPTRYTLMHKICDYIIIRQCWLVHRSEVRHRSHGRKSFGPAHAHALPPLKKRQNHSGWLMIIPPPPQSRPAGFVALPSVKPPGHRLLSAARDMC